MMLSAIGHVHHSPYSKFGYQSLLWTLGVWEWAGELRSREGIGAGMDVGWGPGCRHKAPSQYCSKSKRELKIKKKNHSCSGWQVCFLRLKPPQRGSTPGPSHPHHEILGIYCPSLKNTSHHFSFPSGLTIKWVTLDGPDLFSPLSDAHVRETVMIN